MGKILGGGEQGGPTNRKNYIVNGREKEGYRNMYNER